VAAGQKAIKTVDSQEVGLGIIEGQKFALWDLNSFASGDGSPTGSSPSLLDFVDMSCSDQ